jgi:nitrate reductase gamma subunit
VELPLKAHIRGYSWAAIPITWQNRRSGVAKLKIHEMGSRYMFTVLYLLAGTLLQSRRVSQKRMRVDLSFFFEFQFILLYSKPCVFTDLQGDK